MSKELIKGRLLGARGLRHRWRSLGLAATGLVAVAVLCLGGLVLYQRSVDLRTRQSVEQSYVRRAHMMRVFSLVQDVETSGRGFAMSGNEGFLEPLWKAKKLLPAEMARLKQDAITAHEQPSFARLEFLVNRKLELSAGLITRRRVENLRGGSPASGTGNGRRAMDEIRRVLGAWEDRERRELQHRIAAADRADAALTAGLAALSAAVATLVGLTVGGAILMMRATARAAADLEQSRDEAETANSAKSAFLAMMSHELRTPLNGVLGMAHALSLSQLDAKQQSYLNVIGASGQTLLMILNDILDLSKIEAGKLEIETVDFNLEELLEGVVALWALPAAEKGVALSLELAKGSPRWVSGDPTRLRQVITNLLSNAVKFTDQGAICLRVQAPDSRTVVFEVADSGLGIPAKVQARLFSDFSQADSSTSRKFGGTGLGLSISRKLCRLMGGDLTVFSVEGEGSTFRGSARLSAARAPAAIVADQDVELPRLRVLAVDDNPANRAVADALLSAMGMQVILAQNGAEALEVLGAEAVDLVFLDINMPVMGGVQALQAIRAGQGGRPDVPVVALTADAMVGDRERYLAHGFDDHLAKPIQPRQLAHILGQTARRMTVQAVAPGLGASSAGRPRT